MPWSDQLAIIREDNSFRFGEYVRQRPKGQRFGPSSTQR
jgi:hypothetical protein